MQTMTANGLMLSAGEPRRWQPGDRVVRLLFLDDGTWRRYGDGCLWHSPLRHGKVWRRSLERDDAVVVEWDDGTESTMLDHGVFAESDWAGAEAYAKLDADDRALYRRIAKYQSELYNAEQLAGDAEERLRIAKEGCAHIYARHESSAVCAVCGHDGGWWCPDSSNHLCHYPDGEENCAFCGQPDERK